MSYKIGNTCILCSICLSVRTILMGQVQSLYAGYIPITVAVHELAAVVCCHSHTYAKTKIGNNILIQTLTLQIELEVQYVFYKFVATF